MVDNGGEETSAVAGDQGFRPNDLRQARPGVVLDEALDQVLIRRAAEPLGYRLAERFFPAAFEQAVGKVRSSELLVVDPLEAGPRLLVGFPALDRGEQIAKSLVWITVGGGLHPDWGCAGFKRLHECAFLALRQAENNRGALCVKGVLARFVFEAVETR